MTITSIQQAVAFVAAFSVVAALDLNQLNSGSHISIRSVGKPEKCIARAEEHVWVSVLSGKTDEMPSIHEATLEDCSSGQQLTYDPATQRIRDRDELCLCSDPSREAYSRDADGTALFCDCMTCDVLFNCAWTSDHEGRLREVGGSGPRMCASSGKIGPTIAMEHCADGPAFSFELFRYLPPGAPVGQGSVAGGPHFQTWSGDIFTFLGECDMIFLKNSAFSNGLGMQIQVRTKVHTSWSYVESAAIQIGDYDRLEVQGSKTINKRKTKDYYWMNGKPGDALNDGDMLFLAGFPVFYTRKGEFKHHFRLDLGEGNEVVFETNRSIVSVNVRAPTPDRFAGSLGLMGQFPNGTLLGRDETTVLSLEDTKAIGKEWQRMSDEPMLFHIMDNTIQHPQECRMAQQPHSVKKGRTMRARAH